MKVDPFRKQSEQKKNFKPRGVFTEQSINVWAGCCKRPNEPSQEREEAVELREGAWERSILAEELEAHGSFTEQVHC